ncbi:hypothetical protein OJ594_12315, partial [Streptococcus anginosus]|nr:hypothetical protein [Streptococcus anginosus]
TVAEDREALVKAAVDNFGHLDILVLNASGGMETDRGDTVKFLWRLFDGALVESVLMRYPGRVTLCVSSQAGCGMNCPFCATG